MKLLRLVPALLALSWGLPARAQLTQSGVQNTITTNLPSCGDYCISALSLRSVLDVMNQAAFQFTQFPNTYSQLQTFNGGIATSSGTIGNVNSIWTNDGAIANRISDRLFVGAGAIVNGGNQPESPQDWLNVAVGGTQNSQMVALSTLGLTGAAFGSRATDWPATGVASNSIGVSFYGFANNTDGTGLHPAWAGYAECQRATSVNAACLGIEIDPANYGTTVDIAPSAMFPSAGATVALWNGCGGVNGGTAPCSAAFTTLSNTQKFRKGLVFGAASLDTSVGNGGNGVAMEMGIGQEVRWLDTSGNLTGEIYSTKPASQAFITINVPTNGGVLLDQNGVNQLSFENNLMFPAANNAYALGASSFRFSDVYSVLGDFSGGITAAGAAFSGTVGLAPATWTDTQTCTAGQISVDANFVYVCTASNTVKRATLSTF